MDDLKHFFTMPLPIYKMMSESRLISISYEFIRIDSKKVISTKKKQHRGGEKADNMQDMTNSVYFTFPTVVRGKIDKLTVHEAGA